MNSVYVGGDFIVINGSEHHTMKVSCEKVHPRVRICTRLKFKGKDPNCNKLLMIMIQINRWIIGTINARLTTFFTVVKCKCS